MSHRAIKYLNDKRIVYRRYSPDDPTASYDWGWYYADGTYRYYSLFNTKAKINTYRSLKWHLLVLWYLNPDMDKTQFTELASVITYKPNGFTTFNLSADMLKEIINDIYEAMLQVHDEGIITISKIAKVLGCTPRTIHRNMGEELRQEKQLLNHNHEKI
jgi:hypothetical protein